MVCRITPDAGGGWRKELRSFGTMTNELLTLADWLRSGGVTHVAMESTGVYWRPIYNILEAEFEILLVNAQHIKFVPGRKTDVKDAQWIAELLQHGLLKASFIPPVEQRCQCQKKSGSFSYLVMDSLSGMQDPQAQQAKMSPPIHLAFEKFESVDVPFNLPITPNLGDARVYSGEVTVNACGEATKSGKIGLFGLCEPSV